MPVIQIDTEVLKIIVKESVIEAIKAERLKFYETIIPPVSNLEMKDIIAKYGEKPVETEYIEKTGWFEDEN